MRRTYLITGGLVMGAAALSVLAMAWTAIWVLNGWDWLALGGFVSVQLLGFTIGYAIAKAE